MGFAPFIPHREYISQSSTQDVVRHAWQEIESRCLLPGGQDFADFADQARCYFVDACRSEWKSAGLLYYYSFLNLTKVLLVKTGISTHNELTTVAAYHGLAAEQQAPATIADFEFHVHPPRQTNGRLNLFALMYESLLDVGWPFTSKITVTLREILPYSIEIASESRTHLSINPAVFLVQSLLRTEPLNKNQGWIEMLVNEMHSNAIVSALSSTSLQVVAFDAMSGMDAIDWLMAARRPKASMREHVLLRTASSGTIPKSPLERHCVLHVSDDNNTWWFIKDISLCRKEMRWHPLLSDYLLSFCISTMLRYQPYLLRTGTVDRFIAESWCRQSPVTMLRYFLIALTNPAVLVRCTI